MYSKVDILAVGVHPDDIELSCSGYLLKEIKAGKKISLLDLTWGELGTRGSGLLRKKEALDASKLMGAVSREFLNIGDGFFEPEKKNLLQIITKVRKYRPEIVLANALKDRHPDHSRAADLIARACFLSGLRKIETKDLSKSQQAWRPKVVYHYIQDHTLYPDVVVDITPYMERKMELIMAFKSQFYNPNSKEPMSPISSKEFLNYQYSQAEIYGRYIGAKYGEGFNVSRPVGVESLFDLL
jgi:N-acetylglucosamine malate deacetylase 1